MIHHNKKKLLIVTQTIDQDDLYLGFFHAWVAELSGYFEQVEVICLFEGRHQLPAHVTVHSLGKEKGRASRWVYARRFLSLAWRLRGRYGTVFVHMNEEYVLMAGWLWKLLGKAIFMWRNHYDGSWRTDAAAALCKRVFCTSKFSYTAKYAHTVLMPVGVDTKLYKPVSEPKEHSVLFYARMAPSKRPELLLDALKQLYARGVEFSASFVGTALTKDLAFEKELKAAAASLGERVTFAPGRPPQENPPIFSSHTAYVDPSRSGMYNKMMFEAAACGCLVLASSRDWAALAGDRFSFAEGNAAELAEKLEALLMLNETGRIEAVAHLKHIVEQHSLSQLGRALSHVLEE